MRELKLFEVRAKRIIRESYGKSGSKIRWRWEPQQKPDDWTPGDRFPMEGGTL